METETRGRYRPRRSGRQPHRRGWLVGLGVVAAMVVAANVALGPEGDVSATLGRDADSSTVGSLRGDASQGVDAEPRGDSAARGRDRPPIGEGEPPTEDAADGEPAVSATVYLPTVNGRVQPEAISSPRSGSGKYEIVPGADSAPGAGDVVRYLVEVEGDLPFDSEEFAATVHEILNDERGWGASEDVRFKRVHDGSVDFRVSLSSPDLTDEQCYPLLTRGQVSCWNGARAVINAERWGTGAETFGDDILTYREYLINHEVGHALGHGHVDCPKKGKPAPVMVQQTKSLGGCKANPWPNP